MLYCEWRYLGTDPVKGWGAENAPPWLSGQKAVRMGFAMYAGEIDETLFAILDALAGDDEDEPEATASASPVREVERVRKA